MIYLIRHGQTDANRQRYAGREDVELNRTGRRQALALVDHLRHCSLAQILCSPLRRAIQTATPLATAHKVSPRLCPELVEFDFGVLQGRNKLDHRLSLRKKHLYVPITGGESLFNVWQRIELVSLEINTIVKKQGSVAIVGHYWTNRLLYGRLTGLSLEATLETNSYKPETGTYTEIAPNALTQKSRFRI